MSPAGIVRAAGIVLAAGAGTRLRPLTNLRPKALCPVGNTPLVDLALARVAAVGVTDIAVNAHHLAEQLMAHLAGRVQLSLEQPVALGTAGAVGALRGWLAGRPALVCNSDAYLDGGLAALMHGWDGNRPRVLVVRDPAAGDFGPWRFAGASLLPWSHAERLRPAPAGLYEAVWRDAETSGELELVEHTGVFIDCGTPPAYLAANLHVSGGASVLAPDSDVEGELDRCVIWPQAVVRRGERLVQCVRTEGGLTVDCSVGKTT